MRFKEGLSDIFMSADQIAEISPLSLAFLLPLLLPFQTSLEQGWAGSALAAWGELARACAGSGQPAQLPKAAHGDNPCLEVSSSPCTGAPAGLDQSGGLRHLQALLQVGLGPSGNE